MNPDKNLKDYRKESFFCNECKVFHRYLSKGKISKKHLEHFVYKTLYKSQFTQAELFTIDFKKKWKREGTKKTKL